MTDPDTYCTTFCNMPHNVRTGKPVQHECYILPPAALKAEMVGDYDQACYLIDKQKEMGKRRAHKGTK